MASSAEWVSARLRTKVVAGSCPVAVNKSSDITPVPRKKFLDVNATSECRFTLNANVT